MRKLQTGWISISLIVLGVPLSAPGQAIDTRAVSVARLSSSGFPKAQSLQEIVNWPGEIVDVPLGEYVLSEPLIVRSNVVLRFAPRTVVRAAPGAFRGIEDSLIVIAGVQNVTLQAEGCTFAMRKDDYEDLDVYKSSEWRHVMTILGSSNIAILGGRYETSGGDGIYIGPLVSLSQRIPCDHVRISGVTCYDNYRQGISVLATSETLIEDSLLSGTIGTSPQSGMDIEPEHGDSVDLVIRNCLSKGNRGPAYMVNLSKVTPDRSIHIEFQNCATAAVPPDQLDFRTIGVFDERGRLEDNLPMGTYLSWNGLVWRK